MTLRKKISLWVIALCLIAFAAWAANPSFSSFLTSQFATAGNVIGIKPQATMTNITFKTFGGLAAVSAEDSLGLGPILQVRDQTPTTQFYVDFDGTVHVHSVLSLDYSTANTLIKSDGSLHAVSIPNAAGFLLGDGLGGFSYSSSPSGIDWTTNGLTSLSAFPVSAGGTYALSNMTSGLTFTGLAGSDSTHDRWGVVILDANGADRTLTLPANWRVPDGTRTITVTNGVVGVLSVNAFANKYTNATYRAYY